MQRLCLFHEFAHILIKCHFLPHIFQFVFYSIWLQVKSHVILSQTISFSWKHCTFSAVTGFYSDCSRSSSVPTEMKGNFATNFEGIWNQPSETCPVQILKWLHHEKCSPDAEKCIQWAMRSARRQTRGAGSRSEGAGSASAAGLPPTGWALRPPASTRGFELSWLMSLRSPHTTPLVKLTLEHSAFPSRHSLPEDSVEASAVF